MGENNLHLCDRTVHSFQHERMAVWDLGEHKPGGVWGMNVQSLVTSTNNLNFAQPEVCKFVILVACPTLLTYLYGNQ